MKHDLNVVLILVLLFLAAQIIGLVIVKNYLKELLPYGIQRPELKEETSFIPIFLMIVFATIIAIIMSHFSAIRLWKLWFFLSVAFTLLIAFSTFISELMALTLAIIFAALKVAKPNVIIHNFTELFIYGGLAAIFVPILNIMSILILLIIISIYDMIAVWKTKHMIKLAKFQSKLKIFAGLLIPYGKNKMAILGGGDIGFPLLVFASKKKFYPAMPFISIGCFVGYLLVILF